MRGSARDWPEMGQKGPKHYKSRHSCHCLGSEITLKFLFRVVGCLFYRDTLYICCEVRFRSILGGLVVRFWPIFKVLKLCKDHRSHDCCWFCLNIWTKFGPELNLGQNLIWARIQLLEIDHFCLLLLLKWAGNLICIAFQRKTLEKAHWGQPKEHYWHFWKQGLLINTFRCTPLKLDKTRSSKREQEKCNQSTTTIKNSTNLQATWV